MRVLILILALLFISGCNSGDKPKEQVQPAQTTKDETEESSSRSNETLEDLVKEVNLEAQLAGTCSNLEIELTTAFLEADSHRPSVIGFCHNDGNVSLEQKPAYIAIAVYDESSKTWAVDMIKHEFMNQPSQFAGILQLEDKSERVVIELHEDPAAFGGTSAIVVSSKDRKIQIERINSTVTQRGKFRTEGNKVLIEDDHTTETYTYNKNTVTHTTNVKEVNTDANLVITYNKVNNDPLFANFQSEKILDVQPGDIISFKPEKPLSLADFQIRTSLERVPDIPDTYVVAKSDIGGTIEFGEYPYDNMIKYYVGDPFWFTSKEYLNKLNNGNMPGSKVQLTTPNSEIKTILKDETLLNESGQSGAINLEYDQYTYAVPFLEGQGDIIYSVIRKLPNGTYLTGDDFIKGWGQPTDIMANKDALEEPLIMIYEFENDHYVEVYLQGDSTGTQAVSIHLF